LVNCPIIVRLASQQALGHDGIGIIGEMPSCGESFLTSGEAYKHSSGKQNAKNLEQLWSFAIAGTSAFFFSGYLGASPTSSKAMREANKTYY
jgi:hypothetical protein